MRCILLLFFLVVFFLHHHGGRSFAEGIRGSQVRSLPGFDGALPFDLETGYVGVDEGETVQLFYYFVKSASDPRNDPLLLWLTGGPGCSDLSGFAHETVMKVMHLDPFADQTLIFGSHLIPNGWLQNIINWPINFREGVNGSLPTVILNPYSWTQVANILFVDLPVGAGFSYAKTPEAASSTGLQSCQQAYQFLQKWLVDHPEFISNPFYAGGNSYVGIILPAIVRMISDGNELGIKPHINLKGYLLGNAFTFPDEKNYLIPFAHGMALISNELYKSLKKNCRGKYFNVNVSNILCEQNLQTMNDITSLKKNCRGKYFNVNVRNILCEQNLQTMNELLAGLNELHVSEPNCSFNSLRLRTFDPPERRFLDEGQIEVYNSEQLSMTKCRSYEYRFSEVWANDHSVREALHVRPGTVKTWVRCNRSLPFSDYMWDSTPYHAYLSTKGYRSLIYSGDHDMAITFLSTQAWIKSLNYPIVDEWRQWRVQNQVAGYTRTYANNMTFATVKGAGHVPPQYNPVECFAMFKRWISYQPL